MITFIDGQQMVGKSTLINGLKEISPWYILHKFQFGEFSKNFGLTTQDELRGFQLGKDLSLLSLISSIGSPRNAVLVDRGPLSTVYYSLTTGRMSKEQVEEFFKYLGSLDQKLFKYVFITAKNQPKMERSKDDQFNGLRDTEKDQDEALKTIIKLAKENKINFIHFENDFSKSPEDNSRELFNLLDEECFF